MNMEIKSCNIIGEGDHYLAYAYLGKDKQTGKKVCLKARGRTEEEAIQKLNCKISSLAYEKKKTEIKLVSELSEAYREILLERVRKNEISSDELNIAVYCIKLFDEKFKEEIIESVDPQKIKKFLRDNIFIEGVVNIADGWDYVKLAEDVLSGMFNWALEKGYISYSPFKDPEYGKCFSGFIAELLDLKNLAIKKGLKRNNCIQMNSGIIIFH